MKSLFKNAHKFLHTKSKQMEEEGLNRRRRGSGVRGKAGYAATGCISLKSSFVLPADTSVFRVFHYDTRIGELLADIVAAFEVSALLCRIAFLD
jgi:hypothetical protein